MVNVWLYALWCFKKYSANNSTVTTVNSQSTTYCEVKKSSILDVLLLVSYCILISYVFQFTFYFNLRKTNFQCFHRLQLNKIRRKKGFLYFQDFVQRQADKLKNNMSECLHKIINGLTFKSLFRTHLPYSLPFRDLLTKMFCQQRCVYDSEKFPQQYLDTSLPRWCITFNAMRFPLKFSHFFSKWECVIVIFCLPCLLIYFGSESDYITFHPEVQSSTFTHVFLFNTHTHAQRLSPSTHSAIGNCISEQGRYL